MIRAHFEQALKLLIRVHAASDGDRPRVIADIGKWLDAPKHDPGPDGRCVSCGERVE